MSAEASGSSIPVDGLESAKLPDTILHRIKVSSQREGGLIDADVPFELIDREGAATDQNHVESLAKQMADRAAVKGGTGQKTAIHLGYIPTEPLLKIADGHHRHDGLQLNGHLKIFSTIEVTDWDSLYGERIREAKDHIFIRFSRVVDWMRKSWQLSELSGSIDLEQAVLLHGQNNSGAKLARKHHLSQDEIEAVKDWVELKEGQWEVKSMTILDHLKVAEHVDPLLTHSARAQEKSKRLEAPTQVMLKHLAINLPDKFDFQQLVMSTAYERDLDGPGVRSLCMALKPIPAYEAAVEFIKGIDWDKFKPVYGESQDRALRRAHDPRMRGSQVLQKSRYEIDSVLARMVQTVERGEPITADMLPAIKEALAATKELSSKAGLVLIKLSGFKETAEQEAAAAARLKAVRLHEAQREAALAEDRRLVAARQAVEQGKAQRVQLDQRAAALTVQARQAAAERIARQTAKPTAAASNSKTPQTTAPHWASRKENTTIAAGNKVAPSLRTEKFIDDLKAYLSRKAKTAPGIITRAQLAAAERLLLEGGFSDPTRTEDFRELDMVRARAHFNDRTTSF